MGHTAWTEPQCLYKGALYLTSVPVQGCTLPYLSTCTRVHFTLTQCLYKGALYLTSVPVQGCTLPDLSACTRVHFTLPQCLYKGALYLNSVPIQGCTLPYLSAWTRVHFTLPQCLTRVHFTLPQCLYKGDLYLYPFLHDDQYTFLIIPVSILLSMGNIWYKSVDNFRTNPNNSCKHPTWRTIIFSLRLFQFSTCFEQPRSHHQENQFYQYDI